jgi:hypothetical protein
MCGAPIFSNRRRINVSKSLASSLEHVVHEHLVHNSGAGP